MSIAPGDLVFCHSKGLVGRAIRLGERLRFRSGDFYNHVGIIWHATITGRDWWVIEAEARGVKMGLLSAIAPGGSYEVVSVPGADQARVVAFARDQIGYEYGYLTIVSIAARILLPRWFPLPTLRMRSTWICSALAGEAARFGGWLHNWSSIYQVVPSELYAALHDIPVRSVADHMKEH